jgi:ribonuclease P protein component
VVADHFDFRGNNVKSNNKRLKSPVDFRHCYEKGRVKKSSIGVIHYLENELPYSRIGIAVSKKLGNAVVRNRVKRRIKAILHSIRLVEGFDVVISARLSAKEADYQRLYRGITELLTQGNLIIYSQEGN